MSLFMIVWGLSALGFLSLSLAMSKHQKQYLLPALTNKQTQCVQLLGWGLLVLTLIVSINHYGVANGISYWVGILSFSALLILAMLSYFPSKFKAVASFLGIFSIIGICLLMMS